MSLDIKGTTEDLYNNIASSSKTNRSLTPIPFAPLNLYIYYLKNINKTCGCNQLEIRHSFRFRGPSAYSIFWCPNLNGLQFFQGYMWRRPISSKSRIRIVYLYENICHFLVKKVIFFTFSLIFFFKKQTLKTNLDLLNIGPCNAYLWKKNEILWDLGIKTLHTLRCCKNWKEYRWNSWLL